MLSFFSQAELTSVLARRTSKTSSKTPVVSSTSGLRASLLVSYANGSMSSLGHFFVGSGFAFVQFEEPRDAEDGTSSVFTRRNHLCYLDFFSSLSLHCWSSAVRDLDGKEMMGKIVAVQISDGRRRERPRSRSPPRTGVLSPLVFFSVCFSLLPFSLLIRWFPLLPFHSDSVPLQLLS